MWVLASASPRRRELLTRTGAGFIIDPSHYREENQADIPIEELVCRQALGKARETFARRGGDMAVLGADTLVSCDDEPLGKPKDITDARRMIRLLAGRTHQVWTGIALVHSDMEETRSVVTEVTMRVITETELTWYLEGVEWMDKAGAYAIQGQAALFVKKIVGSYSNVVGLPLAQTWQLLTEKGVAWNG